MVLQGTLVSTGAINRGRAGVLTAVSPTAAPVSVRTVTLVQPGNTDPPSSAAAPATAPLGLATAMAVTFTLLPGIAPVLTMRRTTAEPSLAAWVEIEIGVVVGLGESIEQDLLEAASSACQRTARSSHVCRFMTWTYAATAERATQRSVSECVGHRQWIVFTGWLVPAHVR